MLLFVLILVFQATTGVAAGNDDDDSKTTIEIIRENNYPVEKHWTRTEDGYWLQLHRIPHGKNENATMRNRTKEIFFVQHGLTASSSNFVVNHDCLAFTLADAGYDVWLGNTRGNVYSRNHAFHGNESEEFWDFSFDEMAKYDLPAMIDHVLADTKQKNLWYVGHSQGTMIMFAKLSDVPEFGDKIKGFFAMAPVAKLDTIYGPIKIASRVFVGLKWVLDRIQLRRLPLPYHLLKKLMKALCILDKRFCDIVTYEISKNDATYIDWTKLQKFFAELFTEGDACVKNMLHYCQLIETGKFQKHDYGFFGNLLWYFQRTPPEYHMANIKMDVWLFSGTKDILASREDVDWINKNLGKNVQKNIVIKGYNHLDFLWGKTARKMLYDPIIKFAKEASNRTT